MNDLERALDKIPPPHKPIAGGYSVKCVAHEDRTPSLSLSLGDDGRLLWHCHAGCDQLAVLDALVSLGVAPVSMATPGREHGGDSRPGTPSMEDMRKWVSESVTNLLGNTEALDWVLSRGITTDEVREYRIGLAGRTQVFPFSSLAGRIVISTPTGAEGRSLDGSMPKWKTLPGTKKARAWWAGDSGPLVMVEGAWDALAVARFGGTGIAIRGASNGLSFVDAGMARMRGTTAMLMCPDADMNTNAQVLRTWRDSGKQVNGHAFWVEGNPYGDLGDYLLLDGKEFEAAMSAAMCLHEPDKWVKDELPTELEITL